MDPRLRSVAAPLLMLGLMGACGQRPVADGNPEPIVVPTQSPQSIAPSPDDGKGNPVGMPLPNYVVGPGGLSGSSHLGFGVVELQLVNNGDGPHQISLISLRQPMTREDLAKAVARSGDEIEGSTTLETSPVLAPRESFRFKVKQMPPGDYALIDIAADPPSSRPYGARAKYVWPIVVLEEGAT